MDLNCWIFLAAGILVVAWTALAGRYKKENKPLPGWLAPDWIFGDPTCDPATAPLTMPAHCAIWFGALVGAAFALVVLGFGFGVKPSLDVESLVPLAIGGGLAALFGWFGYRGANAATRYVMVRRATPFEVFIAGAAGAVVSVWFHSGAGSSGGGGSSRSSSSDSDRSTGGGSFGGGGASGKW